MPGHRQHAADTATEQRVIAAPAAGGVRLDGLPRHPASRGRAGLLPGYAGPPRVALTAALPIVADRVGS